MVVVVLVMVVVVMMVMVVMVVVVMVVVKRGMEGVPSCVSAKGCRVEGNPLV